MVFLQTIVIALGNNQDNMRKWLVIFVLQQSQARGNISAGWALSVSFLLLLFWIDVFMGLFKQEQCRRFLNRDILDILFLTRFMVSFTDVLKTQKKKLKKSRTGTSLGGPVVKTLPSNAGDAGSIPKIPHASGSNPKTQDRRNIVTDSVKTLQMIHIKKKKKEKEEVEHVVGKGDGGKG